MSTVRRQLTQHRDQMVKESRATRGGMMAAIHALEGALAKPAPGRESSWETLVLQKIKMLEEAMRSQIAELEGEDNALAAIARDQPRLLPRIYQLRKQYGDLLRQITSLREQLSEEGAPQPTETRQRISWLLMALKHFQAKETDLMFEAVHVDIGAAD